MLVQSMKEKKKKKEEPVEEEIEECEPMEPKEPKEPKVPKTKPPPIPKTNAPTSPKEPEFASPTTTTKKSPPENSKNQKSPRIEPMEVLLQIINRANPLNLFSNFVMIGSGGSGQVYLATDTKKKMEVAIKKNDIIKSTKQKCGHK